VYLDADAAEPAVLLDHLAVEEVRELRVLHGRQQHGVDEIAPGLNRQVHVGLDMSAAPQAAQPRLLAALRSVRVAADVVDIEPEPAQSMRQTRKHVKTRSNRGVTPFFLKKKLPGARYNNLL
jgi:hypothetical protein